MKTLFNLVPAAAISLAVTFFIAPTAVSAQITGSPCQCNDVPYLIRLLGRYNAAIDKLVQLETTVKPSDYFNEILPEPNPTQTTKGESLIKSLREAMDLADLLDTSYLDRPCMQDIEALKVSIHNSTFGKYPENFVLLRAYIRLEKNTFASAAAEVLKRISSMDRCRPLDWFGTITVSESKRMFVTISVPATDEYNFGTEEITDDTTIRSGAIVLSGNVGQPSSIWRVTGKLTRTNQHSGMVDCDTTPQKENLVGIKSGLFTEINTSGSDYVRLDINPEISENGRKFKINFQIPPVDIRGNVSETDMVVGGCPGMARNERKTGTSSPNRIGPTDVESTHPIFLGDARNPQKISGSDEINLVPAAISVSGTTLTHTVRVTYNLYKLKTSLIKPPRRRM